MVKGMAQWAPWAIAAAGAFAIAVRARQDVVRIEADIRARSAITLGRLGVPTTGLAVSGRDLVLTGYQGQPPVDSRTVAALERVEGVRQVQKLILKRSLHDEARLVEQTLSAARIRYIPFETASATLTGEGTRVLDEVVLVLKSSPKLDIEISGHTDSQGYADENLVLSKRRADAVRRYLQLRGVSNRLTTFGHGSERPLADNATFEGRRLNRRIEFHVQEE